MANRQDTSLAENLGKHIVKQPIQNNVYSDITFITNENEVTLDKRFADLIKSTKAFDVIVGYFYISGFHTIYKHLENVKKIRILVGLGVDRKIADLIEMSRRAGQQNLISFDGIGSSAQIKEKISELAKNDVAESDDSIETEHGIKTFIEWLVSRKLEIRAHNSQKLHAKVYIMSFAEGDRDKGRVITGSSNLTQAGLIDNLEFNVELKGRADYEFAEQKFEELWKDGVDVSNRIVETIKKKTWLSDDITPYELYLKFLYEYFRDDLSLDSEINLKYVPKDFLKLEYQAQAVLNAKKILEEYGGVFLSDVVGLGKTFIAAMLADQLEGRHVVIAPPSLLDENNSGSWPNVFADFKVSAARFLSTGKLNHLSAEDIEKIRSADNIFIDEAHRFRTETNKTYENLKNICWGKKIILVTATPLNNRPEDLLSQIKLFQKSKNSTIPGSKNLDKLFNDLTRRLKGLDRQSDHDEYIRIVRDNAKQIREKVLKYLMVRRTRTEVLKYFGEDLKKRGLKFPDVEDPRATYYEFNKVEDDVFNSTIKLISKFHYARYAPLLDLKAGVSQPEELAQKNMRKFMKVLLIKRLESSFFAFRKTLERFMRSYKIFTDTYEKGKVFVSKKYTERIFDILETGDINDESIQKLVEEDRAKEFSAKDFKPEFKVKLQDDIKILNELDSLWHQIDRDPKVLKLIDILQSDPLLKNSKVILFTESKETAEYLRDGMPATLKNQVLLFHGGSDASTREKVIENFDANARDKKDDFRILISTEVLSEGVNLHRSNVVINYDIPWNPTRLMQRVGRINRVSTKLPHQKIYTYNFFPTIQANNQIKLKEAAEAKIEAFIEMLGNDARLLTDEEIKSQGLFNKLNSKKTITGEDESEESELKYLQIIRDIKENDVSLFDHIKNLPKKARTARKFDRKSGLLTYFRKSKLQKFYLSGEELDFMTAAKILEAQKSDRQETFDRKTFYELLEQNKTQFKITTAEEFQEERRRGGGDSTTKILRYVKAIKLFKGFTEDEEEFIFNCERLLLEGVLSRQTQKDLIKKLNVLRNKDPREILLILRTIPSGLFKELGSAAQIHGPREVILSEYLLPK